MGLEKLPAVIAESKFTDKGLVEADSGLLVPVYVGSQMGFSVPGRYFIDNVFYPKLLELRVLPLCPFKACGEYMDISNLFNEELSVKKSKEHWDRFNGLVGVVNYETLMPKSEFMIALMDGSHALDDGLSAEVGYYAERLGDVIGIRSDFRMAENIAALINPAVSYFMKAKAYGNGRLFTGMDAYERAYEAIKEKADKIIHDKTINKNHS